MCQDETRLGLKTITGRLITAPGVKPIGLSQWQRDNFYLYGVVEPLSGYSFFYEFSHLDGETVFKGFYSCCRQNLARTLQLSSLTKPHFTQLKPLIVQKILYLFSNHPTLQN